jgi:hypothetical protein
MDDPAQKGTLDLTTVSESGAAIETKSIPVSASSRRLVVARASSQDTTSSPSLPILARERLKVRIEGNEVPGKARIQVLSGEGEGAAEILASSDSTELAWSPKKEGAYKISAEAKLASGSTWAVEDTVTVQSGAAARVGARRTPARSSSMTARSFRFRCGSSARPTSKKRASTPGSRCARRSSGRATNPWK